ncbi:SCO family protein [Acidomonas methanolica]|uniref:Electron transport transmembrane protein Sco1/SenC/PrrC n=1 Tax=Acidomonas methanolica NBRC 104435 TaxID=1231351 RepID=A0A023D8W7_ACIMT|nr:SCO family protein [Acidomonas methanolica]MBU2653447.1 SCO family protein [Acidomonas methanolica]TCS32399.1 protein SCO1/2 [Acidomonas methanolica]GAJ30226.1 electron transport transmembrane protein Sco1/SenC/PrrC [Acidomonas methanolica NBRC 104435]GBQ52366.1 hypothetical protein AA0498_1733 [Acidomonas methanolica]GEK97836.1 hypothetical protein AME01nite_03350 [Acidomonas methanolica NBRC 104435]
MRFFNGNWKRKLFAPWTGRRVLFFAVLLAVALGWLSFRAVDRLGMPVRTGTNEIGGSYRLMTVSDDTVTEGDFLGRWTLIWFFDTSCPRSVCVPKLNVMSETVHDLAAAHISAAALAVTLDPMHDDSDRLKSYVLGTAPEVRPLTAAPRVIENMAREFHVPDEMITAADGARYHRPAPRIVIMDPQGRYAGTVDADVQAAALEERIRTLAGRH